MYKRFIRWASDRLDDDGIVAFITNRAYLDTRQDDGFREVAVKEFSDLYVVDLGSDVRRNPKISGTTHNVFGIQTGVSIGFFVREKAKLGECGIHYARREDAELAVDKLAYLREARIDEIAFEDIRPDKKNNWLNQSKTDFPSLMPLADNQTKHSKTAGEEQAVFGLHSLGVSTNRDEWVYDFDVHSLRQKVLYFSDTYCELINQGNTSFPPTIKWSSSLRERFLREDRIFYNDANRIESLYRPFTTKQYFAEPLMNDRLTRNHYEMFGADLKHENHVICFKGPTADYFSVLSANKLTEIKFAGTNNGGTFCLPLYRYTPDGERVSNITDWGLRQFREHYGDESITAEDIFAYAYAVLHDPEYREKYAVDLLREFPRLPLYRDFGNWKRLGQELLDLHINFEAAEPYPLERAESGPPGRPVLRADKERGFIALDGRTTLTGVPESAWRYRLGSRSALEWVLDQHKERKPRDPTIAAKFNTYKFADHKERVIDLLQRVCTVSVETIRLIDQMNQLSSAEPENSRYISNT